MIMTMSVLLMIFAAFLAAVAGDAIIDILRGHRDGKSRVGAHERLMIWLGLVIIVLCAFAIYSLWGIAVDFAAVPDVQPVQPAVYSI